VLRERLETVRLVFAQQWEMYQSGSPSVANRIYNIAQPQVRAIRRSKPGRKFEWGAKISSSCVDGFAFIERMQWDPFNETADLVTAAERYRLSRGRYPERILADRIYRTRANRNWCRARGIRLAGIGPGRPPKDPERRAAIGRGKRRYTLGRIMTKLAGTSEVAIAIVFLVMNLMRIAQILLVSVGFWLGAVLLDLCRSVTQCFAEVDRAALRPRGPRLLAAG